MVPRAEPARQIAAGRTLCGYYFSDSGRRTDRQPCSWIERLKAAIPTQIDSTTARFSSAGEDSNAVLRHLGNLFSHFATAGVFAAARAIQYYTSQQIRWVFGTLATDMEP
jgi:hypothetical protein